MSLETYKKIEIESELEKLINSGMTKEDAAIILVDRSDAEYINYIIEACLMPISEITSEIEKYDSSNPKLDEIKFINELCKKYNVDRKAVFERIQNVRRINKQEKIDTPVRLEILKEKRNLLEKEKRIIFDSEKMDSEEKSMYYFGLGVVTIVGGLLFYNESPVLVGTLPVVYASGVPTIRMFQISKRKKAIINELVDLYREIEYLEKRLKEKEGLILDKDYSCVNVSLLETFSEQETIIEGPKLVKSKK